MQHYSFNCTTLQLQHLWLFSYIHFHFHIEPSQLRRRASPPPAPRHRTVKKEIFQNQNRLGVAMACSSTVQAFYVCGRPQSTQKHHPPLTWDLTCGLCAGLVACTMVVGAVRWGARGPARPPAISKNQFNIFEMRDAETRSPRGVCTAAGQPLTKTTGERSQVSADVYG